MSERMASGLTREQALERIRLAEATRTKPMRSGCLDHSRPAVRPEPPAPGLVLWGSDCTACMNATPASMRCDDCKSDRYTVALWEQAP